MSFLRASPAFRSLARSYATAAPKTAQPPVIPPGLAGKYAGALFSAASKAGSGGKVLTQVESDLVSLQGLIKSSPEVATFLNNPTLAASEKASGMKDLLGKVGSNASDYTRNFLNVLAENGRLYETEKVIEAFQQIMSSYKGELEITITSAAPLDKSTTDRIRKSIESSKIAKEYNSLKVTNKVHTDLIGGIIVDFGDEKTVDLSVKSRVQKLDQLISQSI
ncbi:F1 complex, OSCP/delta subunit of ATPase [Cystobasidium minutum MCA 4210]|uniref:F1 complex, OSCP/delta subunit of ATPase n=1 Tax=Cystobasidium minutum MCA 4210 TaxID=1397322 RepID=UPI0034CFD7F0|eukprot:jgi/Rhomi1/168153/fgenesh1_kg.2_\